MTTHHISTIDKRMAERIMKQMLKSGQKGKLVFKGRKFGLSNYEVKIT